MSYFVPSFVWEKKTCFTIIETDQSKPVSQTAADQPKLVSYTDSSSGEDDLHVDVNFDEPLNDLAINWFFVFKIEFQRNK